MGRFLVATAAAVVCSIGAVSPASADVLFTLQGVTFADGATATGSFTTDDAFSKVFSASISTTAGTVSLGFFGSAPIAAYTYSDVTLPGGGLLYVQSGNDQQRQLRLLGPDNRQLYLTVPSFGLGTNNLTLSGGLTSREFLGIRGRSAVGGALVGAAIPVANAAVPEPATWGMMILGFGVAGLAMRRRAKVRTTVSFA